MIDRLQHHTRSGFRGPATALGPGDVVIVGAGLAGLYTALKLAPLPVTVVSAAPLGAGAASVWAQGGIAAAVGEGDTPERHAADTIAAGGGIVDKMVAEIVTREAPDRIRDLLSYGIPFDRDLAGNFVLSQEAAHSAKRIVRVSGDRAGAAIMHTLITAVRATPSVRLLEGYNVSDLLAEDGRVTGLRLTRSDMRTSGSHDFLPVSAVVVATGGIGSLYAVTTNPDTARGEALAFAARAGALIADAEFVQFHPTAIDVGAHPAPLATEALRGEGAILINDRGDRFMQDRHGLAELAPRDTVARAVADEIRAGRRTFLDCRRAIGSRFPKAFPTVYAHCRAAGIDPRFEPIPVAPAAHYHMGGIATDLSGRSTVEGLWAVGEAAATGLHGANRLASNSLLEAVVFADRVAIDIRRIVSQERAAPIAEFRAVRTGQPADLAVRSTAVARLRRAMDAHAGVVRDGSGLLDALSTFKEIADGAGTDTALSNMALAASLITASALRRRESRGAHYRSDFPARTPSFAHRSLISLAELETLQRDLLRGPQDIYPAVSGGQ